MARLQILQLPEGVDDSRPPYVLVVDETLPQRVIIGMDHGPMRDYWHEVADQIGARGVIVTAETVEIPANEVSLPEPVELVAEASEGVKSDAAWWGEQAELKVKRFAEAHHRELVDRMDEITEALGFDRLRDWDAIVEAAKRVRIDGASGHHFGGDRYDDPLRCAKCGIERTEWVARRDAPSCATELIRKGLI